MRKAAKTTTSDRVASARLVSMNAVCEMTSLCRRTVYVMVRDGQFPKPVQLGKRRIAWREADVVRWLESREQVAWAA
jgi:prophage regulatory protein